MSSGRKKRILFSPLDWGIGHASRSIFLIRQLVDAGFEVLPAADGPACSLLESVFPDLDIIRLPFYRIRYSQHIPAVWKIFLSLPSIVKAIGREHINTAGIVKKYGIDVIVSDNRYGVYHQDVTSIIVIHQLKIRLPSGISFLEPVLFRRHMKFLSKFDRIWVPDFAGEPSLAGALSHPANVPPNVRNKIRYGGIISRFMVPEYSRMYPVRKVFDVVVVLSGPEPQRSALEKILIRKLRKKCWKVLIIRGIPWKKQGGSVYGNIQLVSHLPPNLFYTYLKKASYIVSRAGYTSIMDLVVLGKPALLIPTPGQTEQEYLADHLAAENYFVAMPQNNIDIEKAFEQLKQTRLFPVREGKNFAKEIFQWLKE